MTSQGIEIPEIFRLIQQRAPVGELLRQINEDVPEPEKVYLGLEELAGREDGKDGLGALRKQPSAVKNAAKTLYFKPDLDRHELEEKLGIGRFDEPFKQPLFGTSDSRIRVHRIARARGYTNSSSSSEFVAHHEEQKNRDLSLRSKGLSLQMAGEIDSEVVNISLTFGVIEPIYLELASPREILEIRTLDSPKFLLIGSESHYSALEFSKFVKKINPDVKPFFIDFRAQPLDAIVKNLRGEELHFLQGDGLRVPYRRSSMDAVYTNHFFRSMTMAPLSEKPTDREINPYDPVHEGLVRERIYLIFKEVYDTLKPGGKFYVVEPHGRPQGPTNITHGGFPLKSLVEHGLLDSAERAGFKIKILQQPFQYLFRPEVGKSLVDSNGFAHYGANVLIRSPRECLGMVCQKPY